MCINLFNYENAGLGFFVQSTKALTDAFQALLLNNCCYVMRTSSPSTTSIIQQSINAPVSFTKVLEKLRKPSAENLFYAEAHPRLEPMGQILRKPSAEPKSSESNQTCLDYRVAFEEDNSQNLFYAEVHPRLEPKGQKSRKKLQQMSFTSFTKFRPTDFSVISLLFVKGWQTPSRVIEFIWNTGWEACLQYSVTDKDYKYLQDMPDRFRSWSTKALTDAFQALLLNNRYCVMRTSSPSTTSIIQQSINAPVSFTKRLEITQNNKRRRCDRIQPRVSALGIEPYPFPLPVGGENRGEAPNHSAKALCQTVFVAGRKDNRDQTNTIVYSII